MTVPAQPRSTALLSALGRVLDIALIAVVVVGMTAVVLGRALPLLGHPVFVVAGPSMTPAIPVGAAIVLEPVADGELRVGDVVSLRSGPEQAVFTHRITRLVPRGDGLWVETRGDANAHPDPSITATSAIIGRVGLSIPVAGYVLAVLSTIPGLLLLLATGATLIIAGWWVDAIVADRRWAAAAVVPAAASPPDADALPAPVADQVARPPTRPARRSTAAEARRRRLGSTSSRP